MRTVTWTGTLTAASSVAHGGETRGTSRCCGANSSQPRTVIWCTCRSSPATRCVGGCGGWGRSCCATRWGMRGCCTPRPPTRCVAAGRWPRPATSRCQAAGCRGCASSSLRSGCSARPVAAPSSTGHSMSARSSRTCMRPDTSPGWTPNGRRSPRPSWRATPGRTTRTGTTSPASSAESTPMPSCSSTTLAGLSRSCGAGTRCCSTWRPSLPGRCSAPG